MSIKTVVQRSGLKYGYISQQLNISIQSLSNKLNGVTEFKESEIVKMCRLLNLSVEDFFNLD